MKRIRRQPGRLPASSYDHRSSSAGLSAVMRADGLLCRGVVLWVREYDDPTRTKPKGGTKPGLVPGGYICDVLVYSPGPICTVLREVPISMDSAGLNDHVLWRPRDAGVDISTSDFTVSNPELKYASKARNMDGDHVLISFLDNSLNKPIIVGQVPHPNNNRRASVNDATTYKYRRLIRGISLGVTTSGDVEIDTTQASDGSINSSGGEIPTSTSGHITLAMKLNSLIQVIAPAASAPEPVLQADTFLSDLNLALTEISVFMKAWGVPTTNLDTLIGKTAASYRSAHLEVD